MATKQLIVVSPMSETFQKLYEVLIEIADDENIEITETTEGRELNRLMLLGQSLVIFSNAKTCALFLQENKPTIAKFHTKVILLIPKEIPGKVLAKFLKTGLTEAINEGSPPKTLLHKVKIHLRSIKASSFDFNNDDEDQVVKSNILDLGGESNNINDLSKNKTATSLQDELLGMNNLLKGMGLDIDSKGESQKNNLKLDNVNTNWNSKRRASNSVFDRDNGTVSFKNQREKNIYYPTKKSSPATLKKICEDINKRNNLHQRELKKASLNSRHNILPRSNNKKERSKENGSDSNRDSHEASIETMNYGLGNKKKRSEQSEMSAAAKYDQMEAEILELSNKLNKDSGETTLDLENNLDRSESYSEAKEEIAERPDEIAGYTIEKKSFEKKDQSDEALEDEAQDSFDEDEIKKNKFEKKLHNEFEGEDEVSDSSSEEPGNKARPHKEKKNYPEGINNEQEKKFLEENVAALSKEKKTYLIVDDDDSNNKKEITDDDEGFYKNDPQEDIIIDMSGREQEKKSHNHGAGGEYDSKGSLDDDDQNTTDNSDSSKNNNSESSGTDESLKNNDQKDSKTERNASDNSNKGKGDDLNSSLKDDDRKKTAYSWGNLVDKNQSTSLDMRRNFPPQVDLDLSYLSKNVSEQIIEYHKIKKEFDKKTPFEEVEIEKLLPEERVKEILLPVEEIPKKVIEIDYRGIEFCITVVKLIYNKDTVDDDYFKAVSKELISQYTAYAVFYVYEASSNKHEETFNALTFEHDARKELWETIKDDNSFQENFSKTLPTWRCREIQDKSNKEKFWESSELPLWAKNEMSDKKMELIFPYFDGVDQMGIAIILFPEGIDASQEKSIMITLNSARTAFLNKIQRKNNTASEEIKSKSILDKIKSVFTKVYRFFRGGAE